MGTGIFDEIVCYLLIDSVFSLMLSKMKNFDETFEDQWNTLANISIDDDPDIKLVGIFCFKMN